MLNHVILNGRLVNIPKIETNSENLSICRFRIAVKREKRKGEEKASTDFISCNSFGKTAEFVVRWFKKGDPILVSGRMQIQEYESQKHQCTMREASILVREVNFSLSKRQNETSGEQEEAEDSEDELPF